MKDNNVVAFYCNNCYETVLNCEHNFEQLHEKGLCAKCLKKQNKTKDRWEKLKEWLEKDIEKNHKENEQTDLSVFLHYIAVEQCILQKMQEFSEEE